MFDECEISEDNFEFFMKDKFDPPPVGQSKDEDFDPVVHLELADEKEELEDLDEKAAEDI